MIPFVTNIHMAPGGPRGPFTCYPSRVVVEATGPMEFDCSSQGRRLWLTLPTAQLNMPTGTLKIYDGQIATIEVKKSEAGIPVLAITLTTEANFRITDIPGMPHRIVLEIDRSPLEHFFSGHHILLDPSGAGYKEGAMSPTGLPEAIPCLDICRRLADQLCQAKAKTNLTRINGGFVSVEERLGLARELQPSLMVSLATRVEKKNPQSGFAVKYYYGTQKGQELAICLHEELTRKISIPPRPLEAVNMTLLRESPVPTVLVEAACISHRLDEGLLRDIDFRQLVAQGLFNGLLAYLSGTPLGDKQ